MKLELKNITKTFGTTTALDRLSVTFEEGVYGILGANGAGKSTMINLITDNIPRDHGEKGGAIYFDGREILQMGRDFRKLIGYMPQQQGYYEEFSARAFLKYMASVKGIPKREANRQIDDLLEVVRLTEKAHDKIGSFSGGMKQRVLLAAALLGDPKILILDEPTAGLDPKERVGIRNYISELSRDKIILFATHVVSDIECIADRVLLLKEGRILAEGSPEELIGSIYGKVGEILCSHDEVGLLQQKYKVGNVRQRRDGLALRVVGDELPAEALPVRDTMDLEDVYLYYFE